MDRPTLPSRTSSSSSSSLQSSSPSISSPLSSQNQTSESEPMTSRRADNESLDSSTGGNEASLSDERNKIEMRSKSSTSLSLPSSTSSIPITISTNLASNISNSNLRLSTTPLFPSPLAQASGPHEDGEYFKGEQEEGDSEEEAKLERRRRGTIEDSPLRREMPALFGDPEISPTPGTVSLPSENSLGLEPVSATPRQGLSQRGSTTRDTSPDDTNRTARAVRVRSIGRSGGLAHGFGEELGLSRRRSRASDMSDHSRSSSGGLGTTYAAMITPRTLSAISTSPPAASPPSPTISSPASTSPISRRQSVHLLSPSRSYAPLSPSARAPRSSLSAAMAAPIPSPFPAPPPPNDAIKRQRVPDSVRSAMDFRVPSGPSFVSEALGGSLTLPGPGVMPVAELSMPKTPMGTRAPSPASGSNSGSNSEAHRSPGPSKNSSQASSRRGSTTDKILSPPLASPVFIPGHTSSLSGSSSSAFSPLFPFPSSPTSSYSPRTRDRSRSVYNPSTSNLNNSPDPFKTSFQPIPSSTFNRAKQHDLGVSPLTLGLSPLSLGTTPVRVSSEGMNELTTAQRQAKGLLANNRTSSIPPGANLAPASTDEYAQIILASRNAKMKKWKASTAVNEIIFDAGNGWSKNEEVSRGLIRDSGEMESEREELMEYSKVNKEIEWVDWLDEYRKMKEAKLRAESETKKPNRPSTADAKGKGRMASYEYNPFEATTAGMNLRKTTGFDTEVTTYEPSSTSSPISLPPLTSRSTAPPFNPLSRSISASNTTGSISSGVSPPTKRKKNFKLGTKIDAWWSAVRTSFSVGGEEERGVARERGPSLPNPVGMRSSQTILRTPSLVPRQTLRNATSAQDLSPFKSSSVERLPSGASAVAIGNAFNSLSLASEDSESKGDSRRRNPNLSLTLGPSFSNLSEANLRPVPRTAPPILPRNVSHSTVESFSTSDLPSPPLPMSSASHAAPSIAMTPSGFTPAPQTPWDRTPSYISQADAIFPVRARPKSAKEVKSSGLTGFSMDSVRQHIKLRLTTAKENCDKELTKIVSGITAHVEIELARDEVSDVPFEEGNFVEEGDGFSGTFDMDSESEAPIDEHTDSEGGTSRPPSRSQSLFAPSSVPESSLMARRGSNSKVRTDSPRRMSLAPRSRHVTSLPRQGDYLSGHGPPRESADSISASSSRSNSRNRSPLPPHTLRNVSATGSRSPARSSTSHIPLTTDLAQSEFILILQEIIMIATEILDTPITAFITNSGCCAEYIQRVQKIGKAWEENVELSGRGWYVQLLLAVAGLSRVVEWWEAEKGFWTFDDSDEGDAEPISFIAKPMSNESLRSNRPAAPVEFRSEAPFPSATSSKHSPLGIDLGQQEEQKAETAMETARDADDLRLTVDQVRSQTLLMELSLDGQLFQYLSSAWEDLVGLDAVDCLDSSIADFLYPEDAAVFAEATRQLEADDSHTVEVRFRLRVATSSATSNDEAGAEELYEVMEGKGMLMMDGLGGGPSHTMWVVRPAPPGTSVDGDETKDELFGNYGRDSFKRKLELSPPFIPVTRTMAEPILCRICDRPTPAWFFEKHNETCNETHRLEHDIVECNDGLRELARTVEEIYSALDRRDVASPAEYRGISLLSPTPTPTPPTPLEGLRYPLFPKSQFIPARKAQHRILDQVADIVSTALDISTPSVLEEVDSLPIENQRLLSPNSENKLALVMRWQRPPTEEPALTYLVSDTEERIRFKLNTVNRLRNTILYAEKVRQEWEAKAGAALASVLEDSPLASPLLHPIPSSSNLDPTIDPLDITGTTPTPLRSRNSHIFDAFTPPISPLVGPDDTMRSPGINTLSPRLPTGVPSSRTKSSSIKDFKMLKPISKGAFGSVYLAKKITTGDYYAIKVLKKSDMIAKNQVTNVKAERLILMTQSESDFVVKLYYTFQDKDYLYLVMEYLNGGDCAALVKNMGELPEDWTKRYIAEVVVGLEYLHSSGIIHRDLKPDNLLIDAKGHLKLTDFGLSRIGLLGRQTTMPISMRDRRHFDSSLRSNSTDAGVSNHSSPSSTPLNAIGASQASYFGSLLATDSFSLDTPHSESSGSESLRTMHRGMAAAIDTMASRPASGGPSRAASGAGQKFVGTPDYLAPESILGIGMDAGVDWWALGVICYEFLYGFPPFHDETPEKVFENILSRKIEWHEDEVEISDDARDFMERLMCSDSARRLGANGPEEVKAHPFLAGIEWNNLLAGDVDFVPKISDPESTDYFDSRGAVAQVFEEEEVSPPPLPAHAASDPTVPSIQERRAPRERSETAPLPQDDFGTFNFRNLPILKQANDEVIRKLRDEQFKLSTSIGGDSISTANRILGRKLRAQSLEFGSMVFTASPSETSGSSSSGSRGVSGPTTPFASADLSKKNAPQPPPLGTRNSSHTRRNSMPTRLRSSSVTDLDHPAATEAWSKNFQRRRASGHTIGNSPSEPGPSLPATLMSTPAISPHTTHPPDRARTIDCLVAGKNPITNKVLETMLVRLGCRCVVVPDGGEAILAANSVQFDIIWMDLQMWPISGEKAARYIKSTRSASAKSSIVAVCSYGTAVDDDVGTLFSAVLPKPVMKENLLAVLRKLNFAEKRRGSADSV